MSLVKTGKIFRQIGNQRIKLAEKALKDMLAVDDLKDKSFDIGCGSGLSSLAAKILVRMLFLTMIRLWWCTKELKNRYYNNDNNWKITGPVKILFI